MACHSHFEIGKWIPTLVNSPPREYFTAFDNKHNKFSCKHCLSVTIRIGTTFVALFVIKSSTWNVTLIYSDFIHTNGHCIVSRRFTTSDFENYNQDND